MPGPVQALPKMPDWIDPAQASVFDAPGQGLLRKAVHFLGLDDPTQIMAIGTPMEVGASTGGALEAMAARFPRLVKALSYKAPTVAGKTAQPFFSRLDEATATLPKQTFAPKIAGVVQKGLASQDELAARQVPEFLAGYGNKPITRAALEAHLEANPVPQIEVKILGTEGTKFGSYQLPGGEHYRETLITLPDRGEAGFQKLLTERGKVDQEIAAYHTARGDDRFAPHPPELVQKYNALQARIDAIQSQQLKSSHFDEPNILVHTRSNERNLHGLGRGTFLEEVQSDWHQQGKAKGYQQPALSVAEKSRLAELRPSVLNSTATSADRAEWQRLVNRNEQTGTQVPDAPFKETWPDLALKHHLAEAAADPNTHWLGFTSGETQAARYDLSKQISEIHYSGSNLKAYDHSGNTVLNQTGITPEQLPDYIGKETANKLLAQPKDGTLRSLSGVDLKVGGEGMHTFYDEILPKRLAKIVKPFGGTVERVEIPVAEVLKVKRGLGEAFFQAAEARGELINGRIPVGPNRTLLTRQQIGDQFLSGDLTAFDMSRGLRDEVERGGSTAPGWVLKLTPELKEKILKYGFPLMAGTAAVETDKR